MSYTYRCIFDASFLVNALSRADHRVMERQLFQQIAVIEGFELDTSF